MATGSDIVINILRAFRAVLGVAMFGIGVWMAYGQATLETQAYQGIQTLQRALAHGIPAVSADVVDRQYDGQIVYLHGPLTPGSVTDPVTGITLDAAALRRTVELYQWRENSRLRHGDFNAYWYEQVWSDRLIDSDEFHEPLIGNRQKHVNPKSLPYKTNIGLDPDDMQIGVWRIPVYYYAQWIAQEIPVPDEVLAAAMAPGDWYVSGGYLQPHKGKRADVRFRYDYAPVQVDIYSVIGVARDGVVDLEGNLVELPLIAPGAVDAASLIARAAGTERPRQKHWIAWVFIGILLALRPLTMPFKSLRNFNQAPARRRIPLAAGLAILVTVLVALVV